ncbi:MAG: alpha amylase C-terminal domain-containing protein [Firmicutes bacterium]|nr:alpha amylase C-terminal domain-containing protein [Bacillota bacterium]
MDLGILQRNPQFKPYERDLVARMENYYAAKRRLTRAAPSLSDFANGHRYYGFHRGDGGWYYREWAPAAEKMYLTGDFCGWDRHAHEMRRLEGGNFELFLPGEDALKEGQFVKAIVVHGAQELERIPLYATWVVQDPKSRSWCACIHTAPAFEWTDAGFVPEKDPFIYECHIGMAQEEGKVGSYDEFRQNVLPRVKMLGYNTLQIMAIMEHPYYASFGYQVTNFFATSSRYGLPEGLKALINEAHSLGIAVLLDVVHSHASRNTAEGINEFDGTDYQFFHAGAQGDHSAWGTKCFNYGKDEVIHFLLSNLKYWMEEFHFDGFRFDGVTSMLYHDHGLGTAFTGPEQYFSMNTDVEAVTYLMLANDMVKSIRPSAILIAEDTSAMPGLCLPIEEGGIGFDYRLAMGQPDMWIRLLRDYRDEDWDLNQIYFELVNHRPDEKCIGYCESHDQALVGDKTIMFRLCDAKMYDSMDVFNRDQTVLRGMALHKMLRLITMSLGGQGYLTFMGNEFGHPEWIDFPREGNGWSHEHCRRLWSLADNPELKYKHLQAFDRDMLALAKKDSVLPGWDKQLLVNNGDHVLAYQKGNAVFLFSFESWRSYSSYRIPMSEEGCYRVVMSTDDGAYGGDGRVKHECYRSARQPDGSIGIFIDLPNRCAIVLEKDEPQKPEKPKTTRKKKEN